MRSVVASHGPGSNPRGPKISKFQNRPKRARYRISARKLHGLPGTGPNKTLEKSAVTTSPERRPPATAPHENLRTAAARRRAKRDARPRAKHRMSLDQQASPVAACLQPSSPSSRDQRSTNDAAAAGQQRAILRGTAAREAADCATCARSGATSARLHHDLIGDDRRNNLREAAPTIRPPCATRAHGIARHARELARPDEIGADGFSSSNLAGTISGEEASATSGGGVRL
ncbi:hypothetical protein F511_40829 [Dorcoceras hygrometricum]|uniref:Uncharacterized protein n=1 Tax=Dorcoceras hygrometricum TaxID=472368 RepID=A0A2Z7B1Q4_9LAMI|nr:hypothetical protein F511_40829 [Dorcoceras hygrometricum]